MACATRSGGNGGEAQEAHEEAMWKPKAEDISASMRTWFKLCARFLSPCFDLDDSELLISVDIDVARGARAFSCTQVAIVPVVVQAVDRT